MAEHRSNKANMRSWVKALRSGTFQQGDGSLIRGKDGKTVYCCLGVACEVAIREGLQGLAKVQDGLGDTGRWGFAEIRSSEYNDEQDRYVLENGELPNAVINWLELASADPVIGWDSDESEPITAAMANDNLHWDFNKIADAIEEYYDLTEG